MEIAIIKEKMGKEELRRLLEANYGEMIKADVDVEQGIIALGGEWHSDGQDKLVHEEGSRGSQVWGINYYPHREPEKRIEYTSLINIKPEVGNPSIEVEDKDNREKIKNIVKKLLLSDNETL